MVRAFGVAYTPRLSSFRIFYAPVFKVDQMKPRSQKFSSRVQLGYYLGHHRDQVGMMIRIPGNARPVVRHDCYTLEDLDAASELQPHAEIAKNEKDLLFRTPSSSFTMNPPFAPQVGDEDDSDASDDDRRVHFDDQGGEGIENEENKHFCENHDDLEATGQVDQDAFGDASPIAHRLRPRPPRPDPTPPLPPPPELNEEEFKRIVEGKADVARHMVMIAASSVRVPRSTTEAMRLPEAEQWKSAIHKEIKQMDDLDVWEEVDRAQVAPDATILPFAEQFRVKPDADGEIEKFKYRFCANGSRQVQGKDFNQAYAPVIDPVLFRWLLCVAAAMAMQTRQFDFSGAFLNSVLPKGRIIYIKPHPFYRLKKKGNLLRLKKSLYGNRDSARLWFENMSNKFIELGWHRNKHEPCLFYKRYGKDNSRLAIIVVHVDDGAAAASDASIIENDLKAMRQFYKLEHDELNWYLGMRICKGKGWMGIQADTYIAEMAKRFGLVGSRKVHSPSDPCQVLTKSYETKGDQQIYMQMVGCLIYVSTACRADVSQTASTLSQYLRDPGQIHVKAAKRAIAYLYHTRSKGLVYKEDKSRSQNEMEWISKFDLHGYFDADFATCRDSRRSRSGVLLFMFNGLIAWKSVRQSIVALSSFESETIAASLATRMLLAVRNTLSELFGRMKASTLRGDNKPCIDSIHSNNYSSQRSKHIDIRFKHMHESVINRTCVYIHVSSGDNLADMLTKSQSTKTFLRMMAQIIKNMPMQ